MRETRNYYTIPSNYADCARFGGTISNYSFDGYSTMSDMASQILSDWKFDEQCRKNALNRDRVKKLQKGNN